MTCSQYFSRLFTTSRDAIEFEITARQKADRLRLAGEDLPDGVVAVLVNSAAPEAVSDDLWQEYYAWLIAERAL
jgi:hypothetical protein